MEKVGPRLPRKPKLPEMSLKTGEKCVRHVCTDKIETHIKVSLMFNRFIHKNYEISRRKGSKMSFSFWYFYVYFNGAII